VKQSHFDAIAPICPVCRRDKNLENALKLHHIAARAGNEIEAGLLLCEGCMREFPIIDGIPVIVPDVRTHLSTSILHVLWRDDLPAVIESLLGDCCGPGSAYDLSRQYLSTYTWGHYHDLDPEDAPEQPSVVAALQRAVDLALPAPDGLVVDLGCSVGRTTFELAAATGRMVLGLDVNLSMLQLARRAARGEIRYSLRQGGLVYEQRRFPVDFPDAPRVDFWAADVTCLPLKTGSAAMLSSLNVLDCLSNPYDHLTELARVCMDSGRVMLGCPYDWSPAATTPTHWIGGHSQRSALGGDSAANLRALLTPGALPHSIDRLHILAEQGAVPWSIRVHARSTMHYELHLLVAEAR